jgi:8-oxo-dGTP pyrophosphatase MutT (NUDIX family)
LLIEKALAYVTCEEHLLVFRQPEDPSQGLQVPGGSIEANEDASGAALRETREETGLLDLRVRRYLGSARYELKVDSGPAHLRHYVHVTCTSRRAPRWVWIEATAAACSKRVVRELWWQPLLSVRLDWEMDALLPQLLQRLEP